MCADRKAADASVLKGQASAGIPSLCSSGVEDQDQALALQSRMDAPPCVPQRHGAAALMDGDT